MEPFAEQRTQICDLPIEVLDLFFDYLDVPELKISSLVCLLWSEVAFSGRRMKRVQLKVDYCLKDPEDYLVLFNGSKRQYRHIVLDYSSDEFVPRYFIQLLQNIKRFVSSLMVRPDMFIGLSQLRDILLELPNLEALSLHSRLWNGSDTRDTQSQQFLVLHQLSDLVVENDMSLQFEEFDIRLIAPNLRSLDMDCDSERALEVYTYFSDQLNTVAVSFKSNNYCLRFCGVNFPNLYKIDFYSDDDQFRNTEAVRTIAAFFARLKRLQHATLRCNVTQPIVDVLVDNCLDLSYLHIKTEQLENQSFIRLARLTRLKILVLDGWLKSNLFGDCKPLASLQELHLRSVVINEGAIEFFRCLSKISPQLRMLDATETDLDDDCLRFICSNFPTIQKMVLEFCPNLTVNGFECLDQSPNLRCLSLGFLDLPHHLFKMIPSNKIINFSLFRCDKLTDEDLLEIPHVFPMLTGLEIKSCHLITTAGIQTLRSLIPWCTVLDDNVFIEMYKLRL